MEGRTRKPHIILEECGPRTVPHHPSQDKPWNLQEFLKEIRAEIVYLKDMEMEFDLVGVDAAIANAFRRILLSEVPSMAFDKVNMYNNTSVMQDEVLAHRLGLIPIKADPRQFEYRPEKAEPTEQDTLKFDLKVKCVKDVKTVKDVKEKDGTPFTHVTDQVYSRHMVWVPHGSQQEMFDAQRVGPVEDDILINRMRPGQEIELSLEAVKGIGRDHAKFSPVATASYRLFPTIELKREVEGEAAIRLQKCFSPGVIDVKETSDGRQVARVANARYDSCSRNFLQHSDLKDAVVMGRVNDHFIFSIESVGALTPDILFLEAVKILKKKCTTILNELTQFS